VINEAWEIIKTSIIIALSGFGGWLLTKLLKGYFKNVGETIEKQGILLDDIRNGKVKVMYQQPEACIQFMGRFEKEFDVQDKRLSGVEKKIEQIDSNSKEIKKINNRLDSYEAKQDKMIKKIEHVQSSTDGLSEKWDMEKRSREILTTSNIDFVTAFNRNSESVKEHSEKLEKLGNKLLEKLREGS
jgi:predicted transcriptional regulator